MKATNNSLIKVIASFLIVIFIVGICFAMGLPFSLGRAFAESKQEDRMDSLGFAEDRVLVVLSNKETKSFSSGKTVKMQI